MGAVPAALRSGTLVAAMLTALVACGGPSGGGEPPPTVEYVFKATAEVPANAFDEHSMVWLGEVRGFPPGIGRVTTDWHRSFPVAADGSVEIEVDAREVADGVAPFEPTEVLDWLIFGKAVEYSVSDPAARWKVLHDAYLYQRDVVAGTADLASHQLNVVTQVGQFQYRGYPVFSDRPVTITSTLSEPDGPYTYAVDVGLKAGWNVLYTYREDNAYTVRSRALDGPETISTWTRLSALASSTDESVRGVSVLTQHQLAAGEPGVLYSASFGSSSISVWGPSWLWSDAGNPALVSFQDAYPAAFTSAGMTVDPPEARGAVAAVFAYDADSVRVSGWAADLAASAGELGFLSPEGHRVWLMYADRTTTLTLDSGSNLSTSPGGLTLTHGWNVVEVQPSGTAEDDYVLARITDNPTAWFLIPR